MKPIQFSNVIIHKISTMADGALKIVLITREMASEEMSKLFMYYRQEAIVKIDEPVFNKEDKSPSKRLKDRMFVFHKEKQIKEDFNIWYIQQLDKIGNQYLDKLN
ncbi:MAG: hypothetical protein KKD48_02595 [Nanoarchaeota archaeon]|nr:hypothetical protein [Nanoarchaeota archaeon]